MKIIIDTSTDKPEDIKKAARFLDMLVSGNASDTSSDSFSAPENKEGLMNMFSDSQSKSDEENEDNEDKNEPTIEID